MSNIEKPFNSKSYTISIPTINDVKEFVTIVNNFACNATIKSGRYIVDAKSIMGMFSLDVSKPLTLMLDIGYNGIDDRDELYEAIEKFVIETSE